MSYVKLFGTILHSTVWREPAHVRLVWITMLVMVDRDGLVEASLPGLADAARVTIDECEDALERLSAPDRYSRSSNNEGRRIAVTEGGWLLLNYEVYRKRMSQDDRREKAAQRQNRFRDAHVTPSNALSRPVTLRNAESRSVTPSNAPVTPNNASNDIAEAEAEAEADPPKPPRGQRRKRETLPEVPIPDPFVPTDKHRAYCQQHGLDLELERDAFVGWAEGKTAASWNGTFSTRLANSVRFRRERQGSRPGGNGSPPTTADGSAYVYDPGH